MQLSSKVKQRLKEKYGQWAIVTRASSGIGLALTTQLAEAGFNLMINARNHENLSSVANNLLSKHAIDIKIVDADMAKTEGINKIIQAAQGLNVGLLITSAGYGTSGLFLRSSLEEEINLIRVNCEAVLALTHYFSQRFQQQQRGGMIFLSSLLAFQGVPYSANYAASKAYVQSLAEALAIELKPYGIDVLAAAPGPVETGFAARANMKMGIAAKPSALAVPILKALGRKSHVVPGTLSKMLTYALRTVPRRAKIKIMHKIMQGFAQHQSP